MNKLLLRSSCVAALAAVLLGSSSAHAAERTHLEGWLFDHGQWALRFHPEEGPPAGDVEGGVGVMNVLRARLEGQGGATVEETYTTRLPQAERNGATVSGAVASVSSGGEGDALTLTLAGGWTLTATRLAGTLDGGTVAVSNLRVDVTGRTVYADMVGRSLPVGTRPAADYQALNTPLWTFELSDAPRALPSVLPPGQEWRQALSAAGFVADAAVPGTYSATYRLSGLRATMESFDFFQRSLGLRATGREVMNSLQVIPPHWGGMTIGVTVSAVPEPTVAGLVAVGLLAFALARPRPA